MKFKIITFLILCFYNLTIAQKSDYSISQIPENLKENANSVIREQLIQIEIKSISNMDIKTRKVTTVFNEKGLNNIDAIEYYDKSNSVNTIEATVYNVFGKEIKKLRRKDFIDQSAADGFSIYSDDRVLFLRYTPTEYPFTIVYESKKTSSNTAFIPFWSPIDDYNESVQKSEISITYVKDLGFKFKELNFENRLINKVENANSLTYKVENLLAEKYEVYSVPFKEMTPKVIFGLDTFKLEGVEGSAKSWKEFGLWMNNSLLKGTDELSEETIQKVKSLIGTESDPLKKAKIIYQFVQDKTRYVSIQLGIGGWKPMLAKDVDRLGYGDCKALSNYTKALLKSVGVDSYYTIIYGDVESRDINEDFVSMQGNHAVLALPINNKLCFLECTSQTKPFGFEGDFTDNRLALLVKPEGGEIIRTNKYVNQDNSQIINGSVTLNEKGELTISATIHSKGIQYDDLYLKETLPVAEIKSYYKNRFWNLNNLNVEHFKFENNKENVEITEKLTLKANEAISKNGTEWMIPLNYLNQSANIPQRYRNRKSDFEIDRGYYDEDTVEIKIPQGLTLMAKPENTNLSSKFGEYKTEITIDKDLIVYKRSLLMNKGAYDKSEYEAFRKFKEQIAKQDNSKIIMQKS